MIEHIHVQPQPLSDLLNRGFKLGGSMYRKVSILFYIVTVLYFLANYYVAELLGGGQVSDIFITLANLSYSFFVTAYIMRIMMKGSDETKDFKKWSYVRQMPILLVASVIYWITFVMGTALLVVPGLIVFLYFLLFPSVIAIEQKSVFHSFKRSAQLVKGSFFRVALIYLVFLGIQAFAIILLSLLLVTQSFWLLALVSASVHLLIIPFQATVLNLLYFELRAEREAFDFEVLEYEAQRQLTA